MKTRTKISMLIGASLLLPMFAFAQQLGNLDTLVVSIGNIINKVIPIMFAIALLGFFYGIIMYIFGSEESKVSAKKTMIWGVVALFVMASVWGLVRSIGTALNVNQDSGPAVTPLIPR